MSTKIKPSKAKLLNDIKIGLKEVKLIKSGKMKSYSMDDLLSKSNT